MAACGWHQCQTRLANSLAVSLKSSSQAGAVGFVAGRRRPCLPVGGLSSFLLVRCIHCHEKYAANCCASYPGGFESPGAFLVVAAVTALATVTLFAFDSGMWRWFLLGISAFTLLQAFNCRSLCRRARVAPHTGEICPHCGGRNRVQLWSF